MVEGISIILVGGKTMCEGKCFLYFYNYDFVHIDWYFQKNLAIYQKKITLFTNRILLIGSNLILNAVSLCDFYCIKQLNELFAESVNNN
ncbi:MAG: hypothetical protein IPL55_10505 [Saprospiraceae bacterium]|nr:hypothetical protein [Saprospiraceae bacterium]MBL0026534.1 hypothetical protein [Saprospiraceae bacterium]